MKTIFYNAVTVLSDKLLPNAGFVVENGRFTEIGEHIDIGDINLEGSYVIPGMVDTHIHGFGSFSFEDEACDFYKASAQLKKMGTTSFFATVSPFDSASKLRREWVCPEDSRFKGFHAEGPFLNMKKQGGFLKGQIKPYSKELLYEIAESFKGNLRLMTLAPEEVNLTEVMQLAKASDFRVSAGHTDCDYETAVKAFGLGVSQLTHTYNAMRPIDHRQPGILEAAMLLNDIFCELICDLHHVSLPSADILMRIKTPNKIIAVSDSVPLSEGCYIKGGLVYHEDTIYGSQSSMLEMLINLVHSFKLSLVEAVRVTATNAARINKLSTGEIKEGYDADFLVLSKEFRLISVYTADDFCNKS